MQPDRGIWGVVIVVYAWAVWPSLSREALPTFSSLGTEQQAAIRRSVAPPPLARRHNPYSTPMYYPMWGPESPDGQPHPEWQAALAKDWADLGMTKVHFYAYPNGNGTSNRNYNINQISRAGISNFIQVCQKQHLKIGLRVDLPCTVNDSNGRQVTDYWIAHPNNPDNELTPYFGWLSELIGQMKGHLEYAILGD